MVQLNFDTCNCSEECFVETLENSGYPFKKVYNDTWKCSDGDSFIEVIRNYSPSHAIHLDSPGNENIFKIEGGLKNLTMLLRDACKPNKILSFNSMEYNYKTLELITDF